MLAHKKNVSSRSRKDVSLMTDSVPSILGKLSVELTETADKERSHAQFLRFRKMLYELHSESRFPAVSRVEAYWEPMEQGDENVVTVTLIISARSRKEIASTGEEFIAEAAHRARIRIDEAGSPDDSAGYRDLPVLEQSGRKLVNA